MTKSIETTGRTIDVAVAAALEQLGGIDRDLVTVEVLEKPKSGFLGIGNTDAKIRVTYTPDKKSQAVEFIEGLLERMGNDAEIESSFDGEGNINIELHGENMGTIIGRRGDTLDAISHLTNLVVNKDEEKHVRVLIDTENYRKKREESLSRLANKTASQAVKFRKNITLEPMNAYERHVIHTALQEWRDVTTGSVGVEPNRAVVVYYSPKRRQGQRPVASDKE